MACRHRFNKAPQFLSCIIHLSSGRVYTAVVFSVTSPAELKNYYHNLIFNSKFNLTMEPCEEQWWSVTVMICGSVIPSLSIQDNDDDGDQLVGGQFSSNCGHTVTRGGWGLSLLEVTGYYSSFQLMSPTSRKQPTRSKIKETEY